MVKVISDIIAHCYDLGITEQSISGIERKWIVHWCLSWAIIME